MSERTGAMPDHMRVQVAGTINGVIADLAPMPRRVESGADAGNAARMLDDLSRELGEAAQMLRTRGSA